MDNDTFDAIHVV